MTFEKLISGLVTLLPFLSMDTVWLNPLVGFESLKQGIFNEGRPVLELSLIVHLQSPNLLNFWSSCKVTIPPRFKVGQDGWEEP